MLDAAKIADLALLLIDASIGFEMETFEFLSMLQNHGMPSVMGVLTHLDYFRENKHQRRTRKTMKKRFWKEVNDGAKLFYLSGVSNERYPSTEIHNLSRFISVIKVRELSWRSAHPYVLADRFDVITGKDDDDCSTVSFYGYVRGTHLHKQQFLYVSEEFSWL